MSLKKFLAVLGVFCVIVVCIAIPASAYQYHDNAGADYYGVPYNITYIWGDTTYGATMPTTITSDTYDFSDDIFDEFYVEDNSPEYIALTPVAEDVPSVPHITLTSPYYFPLDPFDVQLSVFWASYSLDVSLVLISPDGTPSPMLNMHFNADDGLGDLSGIILNGISAEGYNTSSYRGAIIYDFSLSTAVANPLAEERAPIFWYNPTPSGARPLTEADMNIAIFDGNVGAADLLLSPLEAFFNFEIFPNFSLGDIFGVFIAILLFVVILKLFAGG